MSRCSPRYVQPALRTVHTKTIIEAQATETAVSEVRVRFAPSPTGHLHVGGARTALFNWLFARRKGGKFILRVEDTDVARSTRESEEAVLRDLKWLGLEWDEGPDVGGPCGPYRQSERFDIYREYADKLVEAGHAFPCFCTEETLEAKRKQAEDEKRPPHYDGTCRHLSAEERQRRIAAGEPHTYRFKVPEGQGRIVINDLIRGEVGWDTEQVLGDFILLRSSGMPVYNFCVAVDDALMKISHVIRAEEHLSNTLRQVLIYKALGFPTPEFAHVSLILGSDRAKLSKRHGATSVDQFGREGYLPVAMINYLSLLGWNDGTEQEVFSVQDIVSKFSLDRITKSAAVFDEGKLTWINAQHIRSLDEPTLATELLHQWVESGLVAPKDAAVPLSTESAFIQQATHLFKGSIDKVTDSVEQLSSAMSYPLEDTIAGTTPGAEGLQALIDDGLAEVAQRILESAAAGELNDDVQRDEALWKAYIKSLGKALGRKGKRLFMPLRLALTGQLQGPDVGAVLRLMKAAEDEGVVVKGMVPLEKRIAELGRLSKSLASPQRV